ncbi:unnamed protein product [Nippostrongylus brasiliensis]|uniref:VWFA domain-containing protein n=1 Tax=Nippostrongylus brasiliensis TaxID=27835 RepID=A0A0N4YXB5_NIPBR|nr:unnamed protein product [Nippostrongylus brasiliensis]
MGGTPTKEIMLRSFEIKSHSRKGSRVMVVIVSNGNGADEKSRNIEKSAATLKATGAEVYAVSLADSANEVGATVLSCASAEGVNNVESDNAIPQPESAVSEEKLVNLGPAKKCPYDKMDLQIILDASSSRREVFEHQRELALSLIERLPISASDHNVAVGISSFTSVPTIRLPLGTGRDKTVVVLMNDGFSQDTWEQVLASSGRLASTKAERFGVALGPEADYRELDHYIGNHDRIYRDGSTEKFLSDVLALLKGEKDCAETDVSSEVVEKKVSLTKE